MRRAKLLTAVSVIAFASAMIAPHYALAAEVAETDGDSSVSELVVTAQRLDAARTGIQTQTGASTYVIGRDAILNQPGGLDAGLNQVILQAPSVVADSFGQLHVRGEHNGLQYRLNGVILPEGISAFAQTLNPRLADKVELITGALPATYGLRTAGIIDITTRDGLEPGGEFGISGGAHATIHPSAEVQGQRGGFNAFASVDWQRNGLGIESPDGGSAPRHDRTEQVHGFAYFEQVLGNNSRVSAVLGTSTALFQIPNISGKQPTPLDGVNGLGPVDPATGRGALLVDGVSTFESASLNETQREITHFAVGSLLQSGADFDYQLSVFARFSSLFFKPDDLGDLLFDGIAQTAYRRDVAGGLQMEGVYRPDGEHTLRGGLATQIDRSSAYTFTRVLSLDSAGNQTSDLPVSLSDSNARTARTYSLYLQDEWRLMDALTVNYGLRYDRFEGEVAEDQLSPRLNLVWNPLGGLTVHAGYSRYFSPPPFELASGGAISAFIGTTAMSPGTVNDPPRAERADYFDLGFSQAIGGSGLTLALDSYFKRSRNLVDEGQFGAPIILAVFNYARGEQWGVEFSANFLRGPLNAYANLAVARAVGKDIVSGQFNFQPDDLAYIADHYIHVDHDQKYTGSAGASYRLGGATLSADMIYGSGLRADGGTPNGDHQDAYVAIDAGVSQRFNLGSVRALTVRVDVVNLFDARYQIRDGSGIGVGAPQYGARRGLFAGVSKRF